jgi:nucleotide-binding universal stress UspA family protein
MERIMVAIDGSPDANRALDAAAALAENTGAELLILNVGGEISSAEMRRLASTDGDLSKRLKQIADDILKQAGKRAERHGVDTVRLQCEWGDPAETIIATAKHEKADVIVVGRRGRGRLSALLLGGVSQKVASLAPCKVLVVP